VAGRNERQAQRDVGSLEANPPIGGGVSSKRGAQRFLIQRNFEDFQHRHAQVSPRTSRLAVSSGQDRRNINPLDMILNMKNNSKKGFTLVEIMIVVVIIGLLAAMAIPAFQKVRQNSQDKTILNNLRQLNAAAQQYFLEHGVTSVTTTQLVGTDSTEKYINSIQAVRG
jgi:type IV pilus assembly protein PilA